MHHGDYTRVLWNEHWMSCCQFSCIHYHRPTMLNRTWAVLLWPLSISLLYCFFFFNEILVAIKKILNVCLVFHSQNLTYYNNFYLLFVIPFSLPWYKFLLWSQSGVILGENPTIWSSFSSIGLRWRVRKLSSHACILSFCCWVYT